MQRTLADVVQLLWRRDFQLPGRMQRFYVTEILQDRWRYYVANYPAEREPGSQKAAGRKQKKFNKREAAEAFLAQVKREWLRKGGVVLGFDSEAHYDVMRALEVLADLPGATLEKAALVFRMCRSEKEMRGGGFVAPSNRQIELDPRPFLLCQNEARRCGATLSEMAGAIILMWLEREAERQIRERTQAEAREYEELKGRNETTRQQLAQVAKEDELMKLLGQQSRAYQEGRNSILMKRNQYQCEWRRKRKEQEAKEQINGKGNSGLQ